MCFGAIGNRRTGGNVSGEWDILINGREGKIVYVVSLELSSFAI